MTSEQNGALGQIPALEEYNSLPSWLERYKESESVLLSSLPARVRTRDEEEPEAEPETNNNEEKVVHIPGDQENLTTSHCQPNSYTKLGKRKHDPEPEAQLQETTSKLQKNQASEDTTPRKENLEVVDEDEDEDEISAREALGDDLFTRVKSLGEALQSSASHFGLPPDLEIVSHASNLTLILKLMKPWRADDETTSLLVGSLLGDQSGYAQSKEILTHVLLPKLINMQEPPSRMLGSAVLQSGKAHPRATVDAVIIPLLLQPEAGSSTVKCDIINRVVKECFSPEAASSLCNRLFCSRAEELRNWVWTEGTVGVVHTLLSQKVVLDEATVEGLVSVLERYCNQFSDSLKFSNLLLNLVSKYGSQVRPYKQVLQQVVSSTKTFLTKSIVTKVAGL